MTHNVRSIARTTVQVSRRALGLGSILLGTVLFIFSCNRGTPQISGYVPVTHTQAVTTNTASPLPVLSTLLPPHTALLMSAPRRGLDSLYQLPSYSAWAGARSLRSGVNKLSTHLTLPPGRSYSLAVRGSKSLIPMVRPTSFPPWLHVATQLKENNFSLRFRADIRVRRVPLRFGGGARPVASSCDPTVTPANGGIHGSVIATTATSISLRVSARLGVGCFYQKIPADRGTLLVRFEARALQGSKPAVCVLEGNQYCARLMNERGPNYSYLVPIQPNSSLYEYANATVAPSTVVYDDIELGEVTLPPALFVIGVPTTSK